MVEVGGGYQASGNVLVDDVPVAVDGLNGECVSIVSCLPYDGR